MEWLEHEQRQRAASGGQKGELEKDGRALRVWKRGSFNLQAIRLLSRSMASLDGVL